MNILRRTTRNIRKPDDVGNLNIRTFTKNNNGLTILSLIIPHDTIHSTLEAAEKKFNNAKRFELFTGYKSEKNLFLYKKLGYKEFKDEQINEMTIKYLEKYVSR
jgi:hypothetical protein